MAIKKSYIIGGVVVGTAIIVVAVTLGVVLTQQQSSGQEKRTCSVDPFIQDPGVVYVKYGTSEAIYPEYGVVNLTFTEGDKLELSCPNGNLMWLDKNKTILETATCISDNKFELDGEEVNWEDLYCSRIPYNSARFTNLTCEADGQEIEIGFYLGDGRFLRTLLVCFDPNRQIAINSYFLIRSVINQRNLNNTRPSSFLQGSGIYNVGGTVNNLYVRANQRATVNTWLGLESTSTKYIEDDTNYFLARGHLVARSDGFWWYEQNSTFYYINVAPQWQTFNAYNWNYGEIAVRDYAAREGVDLQVWNGAYGVTTLPHEETGEEIELYLYVDANGNHGIPAPELYWKVAYEPISKRGIALLGVNNPYQTNVTKSIICTDVSSSVSWLTWTSNLEDGYSYACTIPDLKQTVAGVPDLEVAGLLL